jgi:hypothetical protein
MALRSNRKPNIQKSQQCERQYLICRIGNSQSRIARTDASRFFCAGEKYVLHSAGSLQFLTSLYRIFTRVPAASTVLSLEHTRQFAAGAISELGKVLMQVRETKLWEELYVAAVLEDDPTKVANRIDVAQDALRVRWHELRQMPLARDPERQRVADAIRTLNLIRLHEIEPRAA